MKYLARRLLHAGFVLFGVSILSFAFLSLAPGEYFDEMRLNPQIAPETVQALRARYGLDRPMPVRYYRWLKSVVRGELGFSFAYNLPAAPLLRERARNTLFLTLPATLVTWLIAILIGVWIAAQEGQWLRRLSAAGTSLLLAIPELILALVFLLLAVRTQAFPAGGMVSLDFEQLGAWAKAEDFFSHWFLPAGVLVLGSLPLILRHVQAAMAEVLGSPFLRAARGHGIPRRALLFRYALPAAANPLISLLGFSLGTLLSASLLVENVMSWPGLGPLLLEAILARDLFLVIGAVLFSTAFLIAGNFAADALLYVMDPRIRVE